MTDDGVRDLNAGLANAPRGKTERPSARHDDPANKDPGKEDSTLARGRAVVLGDQSDAIRSVFVARTVVTSAASAGEFAGMETAIEGLAVRGAYLAHLAEGEVEGGGGADLPQGDALRKAYLAHTVAAPTPQRARPARAKRSGSVARAAAKPQRNRAKAKTPVKAKTRTSAASNRPPRANEQRAAGTTVKRRAGSGTRSGVGRSAQKAKRSRR